jgi:hypothetical protein
MAQNNQLQGLIDFIQKATKLGKYNSNTGNGILNAVKTAQKGLSADEPKEIEYLLNHMEELFLRQKNLNLSPQSQAVYFGRIKKGIEDFKKYGTDARSIYTWAPKVRLKKSNKKVTRDMEEASSSNDFPNQRGNIDQSVKEINGIKLNIVTWRLRPGLMVKIELPEDLNDQDVEKIKKFLDLELV